MTTKNIAYTYASRAGSHIYHRYVEDGVRKSEIVDGKDFNLSLYVESYGKVTDKSVYGHDLLEIKFDSLYKFTKYYNQNKADTRIYGHENPVAQFLYQKYGHLPNLIFDLEKDFVILNYDIETDSNPDLDFPNPKDPQNEIISISCKIFGVDRYVTFGMQPYKKQREHDLYVQCKTEKELLRKFVVYVHNVKPDIITGWNTNGFDNPYLIARCVQQLGKELTNYLSPFAKHDKDAVREYKGTYTILGVNLIDYFEMYKKYQLKEKLPSYSLNNVGIYEGVGEKVDYSKYGSLHKFYMQNPQEFIAYNERDVEIVERIDKKRGYLRIAIICAQLSLVNIDQYMSPVKVWDHLVHKAAMKAGTIIPPMVKNSISRKPEGAFVLEPIKGMHKWVRSNDATSLYPSVAMQWNISPETLVDDVDDPKMLDKMLDELSKIEIPFDDLIEAYETKTPSTYDFDAFLKTVKPRREGVISAANGTTYSKDKVGLVPSVMKSTLDGRKLERKKGSECEQLIQIMIKNGETEGLAELENRATLHDATQHAFKILLNSGYGALLNVYFRYFKLELGEAITKTGKMFILYTRASIDKLYNTLLETKSVGYTVYCDTDSAYSSNEQIVNKYFPNLTDDETCDKINEFDKLLFDPYLERCYAVLKAYSNANENYMFMKRELIAKQILFRKKKNYISNVLDSEFTRYATPKLKAIGVETVRSSTPQVVKTILNKCYHEMFYGTEEGLIEHIAEFRDWYYSGDIFDIARPVGVSNLEKYEDLPKGTPAHVKAAITFNRYIKDNDIRGIEPIYSKDKIRWVYLTQPNPFNAETIAFKDEEACNMLNLRDYTNHSVLYEKLFRNPIKSLTDLIGWSTNEHEVKHDAWW